MKMEIKDSGIYIDMTHDAREYKNKIMALNTFATDVDFCNAIVDEWAEAMADSMQTLDGLTDEEIEIAFTDYDDNCPICQAIRAEMQ